MLDGYNHWQRRAVFSKIRQGARPARATCSVCGGDGVLPIAEITQNTSEDGCAEASVSGDIECFLCEGSGKEKS